MGAKGKIGLIGLAVMGANLARNLAGHGISTVVYNRSHDKTENFLKEFGSDTNLSGAAALEELVNSLEKPRKIILMIKAGEAVDAMIAKLIPLLEKDDILIDGGNSFFEDTRRRSREMEALGVHFVGMGVSGGEEGALHGPSLMPGGTREAYDALAPILKAVSAKAEGEACVDYMGPDGAGHYVKMVHNGIEYADMQMIADTYFVMKNVLGMTVEEMADTWETWNKSELSSYLVEITARILRKADEMTGKPLVDVILDVAKQKGTGRWTSMSALALGVPAPTITEAVFARTMSSQKEKDWCFPSGTGILLLKERKWTAPLCLKTCGRLFTRLRFVLMPRASIFLKKRGKYTAGICRWGALQKSGGAAVLSAPVSWIP